jgi:uncharacterized DUF497 family protein
MKRPFDENKRRRLIRERGIDLADAHQIFDGPTYTLRDARRDYGEARYFSVGFVAGRMYVIIWTRRDGERPPPSVGEPRVLTVIAVDVETYEHFRSRGGDWQAAMADTLRGAVKK